jgi:hypothetical protein
MFKIRFHLAQGPNFMQWQIKGPEGIVYLDPALASLTLFGAKLCNQKATAQKIHNGANKSVCAWIKCDRIEIGAAPGGERVMFNPKKCVHWTNDKGENLDKKTFGAIQLRGRALYVV